ncbi:MAG: SpoIID/LytB domain-containing protein [Thermotaleaceae bacterium]
MKHYSIQRYGILFILSMCIMVFINFESINQIDVEDDLPKESIELPLPKIFENSQGQEPYIRVYILEEEKILHLPFEVYIQGVLGGEMPNQWPLEALKAQAILARTYTMDFLMTRKSRYEGADISSDIREAQAWNERAINKNIIRAVEETRGKVVVHENNYAKTWYHSHGGGKTSFAREGFGTRGEEPDHIRIVDSRDSEEAPEVYRAWRASFTKKEVREACRQLGKDPGIIDDIEVVKRGPSGRAVLLRIGKAEVTAAEFRIKIGSKKMRSTLIDQIEVKKSGILISGRGFGHGVGMSQWGALQLAKEGYGAEEIIHYYFKNIDTVKLWD